MAVFNSINPFDQQLIGTYELMGEQQLNKALELSTMAFKDWKRRTFGERASVLINAAAILRNKKSELATLIVKEMGKVLPEAIGEVEKCAWVCEYYAAHAEGFLADELLEAGYVRSFVSHEPIGAVLAIMPWNFPFWQVFRYAAPTLMAGNVTLLKHAPNVCGCSLAIEGIFREAGAPEGVFQSLIIDTPEVERIITADIVQAVTLTGSERAGSSVAALAGKHIKTSVLELGGSDALIVLPDANMQKAAATALQSRLLNAGQSCIGSKRFIVLKDALNDFIHELESGINAYKYGDPFDPTVKVGPMARLDLAQSLEKQLQGSVAKGAGLVHGGQVSGCQFSPSLLLNVQKGMPAFDEETFGPLAAVIVAQDEAEAIALANDSRYGLGGSIWTGDLEKGVALARQIETGAVFINSLVKSDPRLPFGGIKKSGYGRELSRQGILEFVNQKTIAVEA
ncbi:NAD-dependent succinate-semialdehyde dehydrogenase [Flavihumibacter rivuli]|uniref:NAD-dependent succinate-semialdehyde dehydrogenase n=1 Tax=Flavihumibacter rivuli TaxID=2838156 RepID=UPI001BDF008B|nr:NAD-dependent succinate-semialdehyde dehydrogenase [Flavihumibacter rivuli]ULQ55380.1 NAD-dependent succinate-semialdehyde dehydrogenase [Flavihumibacter rivuli]